MNYCYTCELLAQRDEGNVPIWDNIYRTDYWDLVHAYNTALPGWLVLVVRRHIESLDQLTENEAFELGLLIKRSSLALKEVTGCLKTYVLQFAEAKEHPHVHFHIVPRMANQSEDRRGPKILHDLAVPKEEQVSEATMSEIGHKVRRIMQLTFERIDK